jgi:predicted DNA-binding transcriptional regulator AlpA
VTPSSLPATGRQTDGPTDLAAHLPRLLDASALALWLGLKDRKAVYRLVESRQGPPPIRIGSRLRWAVADVQQWLNQQREGSSRGR